MNSLLPHIHSSINGSLIAQSSSEPIWKWWSRSDSRDAATGRAKFKSQFELWRRFCCVSRSTSGGLFFRSASSRGPLVELFSEALLTLLCCTSHCHCRPLMRQTITAFPFQFFALIKAICLKFPTNGDCNLQMFALSDTSAYAVLLRESRPLKLQIEYNGEITFLHKPAF